MKGGGPTRLQVIGIGECGGKANCRAPRCELDVMKKMLRKSVLKIMNLDKLISKHVPLIRGLLRLPLLSHYVWIGGHV